MKDTLHNAIRLVNAEMRLVLLVGVCSIRIPSDLYTTISLVGAVIGLIMTIIVYGRLVARAKGVVIPVASRILKDNWLNFLVVAIVLAAPALFYGLLVKQLLLSRGVALFTQEALYALTLFLTMYVLPIVFIKHENVIAIVAGITYLWSHLKDSLAVSALVALMVTLHSVVTLLVVMTWSPSADIDSYIPVLILGNIVMNYLEFVVFAAATIVLLKPGTEPALSVA